MIKQSHSTYQHELGCGPPAIVRVGGLHMRRLIRPGSIVRTNYATGPYVLVSMRSFDWRDPANGKVYAYWCFCCDAPERDSPKWPRPTSWLNEYVAIGRRILGLMNDDEIIVEGFNADAARILAPKPAPARQLDLFGSAA